MNKRIQELMEQAQDWVDQRAPFASEEHEWFAEKFAELIVRECARVGVSAFERNRKHGLDDIIHAIRGDIVKHFGVEE